MTNKNGTSKPSNEKTLIREDRSYKNPPRSVTDTLKPPPPPDKPSVKEEKK